MTPLQLPDPAPVYVQFPQHKHEQVKNGFKIYPLAENGELHEFIIDDMRNQHEQGERTWTINSLQSVYWDLEMQQEDMGGRFRTRVVLTALLSLHKQMLCWSDPGQYMQNDAEISVADDFQEVLHESVFDVAWSRMRHIVEQNGRNRDQAWIFQVDATLRQSGTEGSTLRIFTMPSPRAVNDWYGPTGPDATWAENPLPPTSAGLQELLLVDYASGQRMPDPPVFVWKKANAIVFED